MKDNSTLFCEAVKKRKIHKALKRKVKCEKCGAQYTEFIGVLENGDKKYYCVKCYKITMVL